MTNELTTTELKRQVAVARESLRVAEDRVREAVEAGDTVSDLDMAYLKLCQDNYYYGLTLLRKRR